MINGKPPENRNKACDWLVALTNDKLQVRTITLLHSFPRIFNFRTLIFTWADFIFPNSVPAWLCMVYKMASLGLSKNTSESLSFFLILAKGVSFCSPNMPDNCCLKFCSISHRRESFIEIFSAKVTKLQFLKQRVIATLHKVDKSRTYISKLYEELSTAFH